MLPVLSRQYGPVPFGQYAILLSLTTLVAIVGTARYEMAIVLPRSEREADAVMHLALRLLVVVSVVIAAITVLVATSQTILSTEWRRLVLLIGPGVFLLGYTSLLTQLLMRAGRFGVVGTSRIWQSAVTGVAQILLGLSVSPTGFGLSLGLIGGQLVAAIVLTGSKGARFRIIRTHPGRRWGYLLRKYRRLPALLMPQTFVDAFRQNGLNLLIGQFSVSALGQYSQASRLVQLPVGLVGSAISQVYFPRLATSPRHQLYQTVRGSVIKAILFGAVPFILILVLSPTVFPLLLGAQWAEAGRYAQALVPALYAILASAPISTVFIVLQKEHVGLVYSIIYSSLSVTTIFALRDDLLLAIWAMSAVQAISSMIYIIVALQLAKRAL